MRNGPFATVEVDLAPLRPHFRKQSQQLLPLLFGHVERLEINALDGRVEIRLLTQTRYSGTLWSSAVSSFTRFALPRDYDAGSL
jgi:hypothetical protein